VSARVFAIEINGGYVAHILEERFLTLTGYWEALLQLTSSVFGRCSITLCCSVCMCVRVYVYVCEHLRTDS
jgi:hypothetical protein